MNLREICEQTVEQAKKRGAQEVAVSVGRTRGVEVEARDGKIDRVQECTEQALSLELYVDGRYSCHSTSDLRLEAREKFLDAAVALTRMLEPDPARALPDPKYYEERANVDLDLEDKTYAEVTALERRNQALELEALTRDCDLEIISATATIEDDTTENVRIHSNGFYGEARGTSFGRSSMLTIKDPNDDRKPLGADGTGARHREDLRSLKEIAQNAIDRARSQLGATHINTDHYDVLVLNRAMPKLLGALLNPLSGAAIQQKRSLYLDKLNQQITSPLLTLHDNPLRPRGLGSGLWDSDGMSTKRRPLILDGVLQTWLVDPYYARKLGMEPTGSDIGELEWSCGSQSFAELCASMNNGLLIERFLGGNANQTTGELSFGCQGHVIRQGQIAEPFIEANFSGSLLPLFSALAALGADAYAEGTAHCPTCLFKGVQISGQ